MSNAAIENVRRLVEWNRQSGPDAQRSAPPPEIGSVGIIGAGIMGTAIAEAHASHLVPVVIHDAEPTAIADAVAAVSKNWGKARSDHSRENPCRVTAAKNISDIARCDLILESIVEILAVKLRLFEELQTTLNETSIVSTNTSTIPIHRLASGISDPARFCGFHFCHPVQERPLVEIVQGPQTGKDTIAALTAHARRIDRIPIVVQDGPGFVVNRLLFPYLAEGLELLREGYPAEAIDSAARDYGMAVGPLRMIDEIGLDTTLQAAWVLAASFPDRILSSPLLVSMIKAGRLGRKTGAGFFSHEGAKSSDVLDPKAEEILLPWVESTQGPQPKVAPARLMLPMLLEASRILEEGKVRDARDIDLAVLFGLGYPTGKGGLLYQADMLGAEGVLTLLSPLETIGPRFQATPMLQSMAKSGSVFYGKP